MNWFKKTITNIKEYISYNKHRTCNIKIKFQIDNKALSYKIKYPTIKSFILREKINIVSKSDNFKRTWDYRYLKIKKEKSMKNKKWLLELSNNQDKEDNVKIFITEDTIRKIIIKDFCKKSINLVLIIMILTLIFTKGKLTYESFIDGKLNDRVSSMFDINSIDSSDILGEGLTEVEQGNEEVLSEEEEKRKNTPEYIKEILDSGKIKGLLTIPKIGLNNVAIKEGVDKNTLKSFIGEYKNTPNFGENGNIALLSHRNYPNNGYFLNLYKLQIGDYVYVISKDGKKYKYEIYSKFSVSETKVEVADVENTDEYKETLTLITCMVDNRYRTVVKAKIVK